ncbi:hypothetical protein PF005_g13100 [Phytophthora fragariae]|uniref:Uncharacterized protein n=1 Tax=Phytophthora fragariae TaxID=53985 RepID=A0A6A3YU52_9STRA|nr:hypothetical protein PF005_g13100 [Phytophthora fragariae]KAE9224823.1 hypothetical protein PF002_g14582 [Phytophthora fragariae]KAE9337644.1 hypothetical protein PF008_g12434 [Phytophthora fragariae]
MGVACAALFVGTHYILCAQECMPITMEENGGHPMI